MKIILSDAENVLHDLMLHGKYMDLQEFAAIGGDLNLLEKAREHCFTIGEIIDYYFSPVYRQAISMKEQLIKFIEKLETEHHCKIYCDNYYEYHEPALVLEYGEAILPVI